MAPRQSTDPFLILKTFKDLLTGTNGLHQRADMGFIFGMLLVFMITIIDLCFGQMKLPEIRFILLINGVRNMKQICYQLFENTVNEYRDDEKPFALMVLMNPPHMPNGLSI